MGTSFTRHEFTTFEEEVEYLHGMTNYRVPPFTEGFAKFLGSTTSWITQGDNPELEDTILVLPDPSLNLSLPYPADELALALTSGTGTQANRRSVETLAERFQLKSELLDRPSTALSGGERMLISLAKAHALASRADRFLLCSPYFWLDLQHRHLVELEFRNRPCEGHLLLLTGEDDLTSSGLEHTENPPLPLSWHLTANDPTVVFPGQAFPRTTKEKTIRFKQLANSVEFQSPTLITGVNGLGKTTLAKLLAGLIEPDTGSIRAVTRALSGCARIVLQDTLLHLFGDSVDEHHNRVFSFEKSLGDKARDILSKITNDCFSRVARKHASSVLGNIQHRTILEAKLAVTVERLFVAPPLLILDEPSWCLSRDVARALVQSTVALAHECGIAVAFISHQQQWWSGIAASELRLTPDEEGNVILGRG